MLGASIWTLIEIEGGVELGGCAELAGCERTVEVRSTHSMTPLQNRVLRTIQRESLITPGGRVVVALSGGGDSVALTRLLSELADTGSFEVVGVAHLNHQLREAADADERFCRTLAGRLSLPCLVGRADVMALAKREQISIEEAGHRERYAFFRHASTALQADRIATAHTRDDQAETYLIRLLRGAGSIGLSGIHPRSGDVVRPLLDVSKSELREYLAVKGQEFQEDETNRDVTVTRNRIRHELIPFLERQFSPSIIDVLVRETKIARYDAEWLECQANAAASAIVRYTDGVAVLDQERLSDQPVALARRIVKRAVERVAGRSVGFDQVERILAIAAEGVAGQKEVDLPGCRAAIAHGCVTIGPPLPRRTVSTLLTGFTYRLEIPGEVEIQEAKMTVAVERVSGGSPTWGMLERSQVAYVDASRVTAPLIVRSWLPGDAFRPLGLGGKKKLQDLFVDRKVKRLSRQEVPIVVDNQGRIVWVVGHSVSDDFRIMRDTEGMLLLKVKKLRIN
jgi:tRNA(Ile)-lysidine synthase